MNSKKIKAWLRENKLLILIVAIGFLLRISLLFWGIPITPYIHCDDFRNACYHADESDALSAIISFPENYFSSERYLGYGTTMQNFIGIPLLPLKAMLSWMLQLDYFYGVSAWIISRFYSVVLGTFAIFLSYLLASKLFEKKITALISAALTTVAAQHILSSSISIPTIPMSFLLVLNFLISFWVIQRDTYSSYIFLGLTSGLLLGTKITGVFFLIIPFLLSLFTKKFRFKHLLVYILVTFFVFIVLHPYTILNPSTYYAFYLEKKRLYLNRVASSFVSVPKIWTKTTNLASGSPIVIPFLLGILFLGSRRLLYKIAPLIYIIFFYSFWRGGLHQEYVAIVMPLISIYSANFFATLISQKNWLVKAFGIIALNSFLIMSLSISLASIYNRLDDPRTSAAKYVMESISEGTTIGFSEVSTEYSWREHAWRYPKIDLKRFHIVNFLEKPEILIVSSFDLQEVIPALDSEKLKPGNIWDENSRSDWYKYIPPSPEVFEFYDLLVSEKNGDYVLLKSFRNIVRNSSLPDLYPEIHIYQKVI